MKKETKESQDMKDQKEAEQNASGGEPGQAAEQAKTSEEQPQQAEELAKVKDQLLRKIAEFDNFRRRTREEQAQLIQYGNEGLLLELLPVLDDFDRSLAAGKDHQDFESFFKGVEILRNKFYGILERKGLAPVEAAGKMFDENFHEALMQVPGTDKEPGTVIDEVEKGYMLHDKVIRHSKVTVAAE